MQPINCPQSSYNSWTTVTTPSKKGLAMYYRASYFTPCGWAGIFRNTTGQQIKISGIHALVGSNANGITGSFILGLLGNSIPTSFGSFSKVSGSDFAVPVYAQSIVNYVSSPSIGLVVGNGQYFYAGVQAENSTNTSAYFCLGARKTNYDVNNSLYVQKNQGVQIVGNVNDGSSWRTQTPEIYVDWDYNIIPISADKNYVEFNEGNGSATINVDTDYANWDYSQSIASFGITKLGSTLIIRHSVYTENDIAGTITLRGLNSQFVINVKAISPKILTCSVSNDDLRPTERAKISYTSEGNIGSISYGLSGDTAYAEIESDYVKAKSRTDNLLNKSVALSVSCINGVGNSRLKTKNIYLQHWNADDIKVDLSSNILLQKAGSKIIGTNLSAFDIQFSLNSSSWTNVGVGESFEITYSNQTAGEKTLYIRITSDTSIGIEKYFTVVANKEFEIVYPKNFGFHITSYYVGAGVEADLYNEGDVLTIGGDQISVYTLVISGEGNLMDFEATNPAPWIDSKGRPIGKVVILQGVTGIGKNAFNGCECITTVLLPKSLKTIGQDAFSTCRLLEVSGYRNVVYNGSAYTEITTIASGNNYLKNGDWNYREWNFTSGHCLPALDLGGSIFFLNFPIQVQIPNLQTAPETFDLGFLKDEDDDEKISITIKKWSNGSWANVTSGLDQLVKDVDESAYKGITYSTDMRDIIFNPNLPHSFVISDEDRSGYYKVEFTLEMLYGVSDSATVGGSQIYKVINYDRVRPEAFKAQSMQDSLVSINTIIDLFNNVLNLYGYSGEVAIILLYTIFPPIIPPYIDLNVRDFREKSEWVLSQLDALRQKIKSEPLLTKGFPDIRKKIAVGEYAMADDSDTILADGKQNTFLYSNRYKTETASPLWEILKFIRALAFPYSAHNLIYKDGATDYNLTYKALTGGTETEYDLIYGQQSVGTILSNLQVLDEERTAENITDANGEQIQVYYNT